MTSAPRTSASGATALRFSGRAVALLLVVLAATWPVAPAHAKDPNILEIRLLSFNDFRGSLVPPDGRAGDVTRADGSVVPSGGAAYLAAYIKQLHSQSQHMLLYSAGDNWGASGLASSAFHDEPTVAFLNMIGVSASVVGNLELAAGYAELRRMQSGGCHPVDGCDFEPQFKGASFPLLAANLDTANGTPATLPFTVDFVEGIPIGVIGVLPRDAARMIAADGTAGLKFNDELDAINRTADLLDFFGVKAITVLLHKGDDSEPGGPDACNLTTSSARRIADRASPKVDVIFTAGGNQGYNCSFTDPMGNPRVFMQGASLGRMLSVADIAIDRSTRDVLRERTSTFNQVVGRDIAPDPATVQLVGRAQAKTAAIASRVVGRVSADITKDVGRSGESPLGNLVADAQLEAARKGGAQLALTNAGGVRADLSVAPAMGEPERGTVTFGEAFAVQPFNNQLALLTLTGAQLHQVLEQQFQPRDDGSIAREVLAPSGNLRYVMRPGAPPGARIAAVAVDGKPVLPDGQYRVVVNSFLADGGDGFTVFRAGRDRAAIGKDTDALVAYLGSNSPVAPPATDRITVQPAP